MCGDTNEFISRITCQLTTKFRTETQKISDELTTKFRAGSENEKSFQRKFVMSEAVLSLRFVIVKRNCYQ
jgi:hypothetical protein